MNKKELNSKAELNLKLLKWIKILTSTWFWLGIWVLYYLKFTDYAGIGLIETCMMLSAIALEVPAGVVSDRFGHKNNIAIFTFLNLVGSVVFATAGNIQSLVMAAILMKGGYAFFSGSYEALMHESLDQLNRNSSYQKQISMNSSLSLATMAISSVIGGFVWAYSFRLNLWLTVPFLVLASLLALGLTNLQGNEFINEGFFSSIKDGVRYIFRPNLRVVLISILGITMLQSIFYQVLGDALPIAAGIGARGLGLMASFGMLVAALSSFVYSKLILLHQYTEKNIRVFGLVYLLICQLSISTNKTITIASFAGRDIFGEILNNTNIEKINKEVPSKHRSTAISSYSFIKALPYAVFALPIGKAIDHFGANKSAFTLSLISLFVYLALSLVFRKKRS